MCLAMAIVLPQMIGHIKMFGKFTLVMHIPVLLCGLLAGPYYGALTGIVAPFAAFLLSGWPELYPTAAAMAAELAVYALVCGLFHQRNRIHVYITLPLAMLTGRAVFGGAMVLMLGMDGKSYLLDVFIADIFLSCWPGIALQILLIPPIVMALERADLYRPGRRYT